VDIGAGDEIAGEDRPEPWMMGKYGLRPAEAIERRRAMAAAMRRSCKALA
jgi:hypothetical protein